MKTTVFVLAIGMVFCVAVRAYAAPECSSEGNCQPQSCSTESQACAGSACGGGCCGSKPLQGHVSTDVAARLSAGTDAIRRGQLETAANCYQYVLQQDPHNAEALYGTGFLAERNGQLPHALFFYRLAAVNDPNNGSYRTALYALQKQMNIPVVPVSMLLQPVSTVTALPAPCPDLCVATNKPESKKSKFLKAAGTVGKFLITTGAAAAAASAASGGLHCPVCRMLP